MQHDARYLVFAAHETVREFVIQRYQRGPFIPLPTTADAQPGPTTRVITFSRQRQGVVVHEQGCQMQPGMFGSWLCEHFGEIIEHGMFGQFRLTRRADASIQLASLDTPFDLTALEDEQERYCFQLDPAAQHRGYANFIRQLEPTIRAAFPIRAGAASLEWVDHELIEPDVPFHPGIFRFDSLLQVTLRLVLCTDGGEIADVLQQSGVLLHAAAMTPSGGFVHRGIERFEPVDEWATQERSALQALVKSIHRRMAKQISYVGVTPYDLVGG